MSESRKKCSKSPSGKQTLSALKNLIKGELRRIDLLWSRQSINDDKYMWVNMIAVYISLLNLDQSIFRVAIVWLILTQIARRTSGFITIFKNGRKERRRSKKSWCWQEGKKKKSWDLLHLHLQGPQAGPPRHWYLQEGHEHHELFHPRHLRQNRHRRIQARQIQQEKNPFFPRGPIRCQAHPPRRVGQTCRFRRNQGRHQVHPTMILHGFSAPNIATVLFCTINRFRICLNQNKELLRHM